MIMMISQGDDLVCLEAMKQGAKACLAKGTITEKNLHTTVLQAINPDSFHEQLSADIL